MRRILLEVAWVALFGLLLLGYRGGYEAEGAAQVTIGEMEIRSLSSPQGGEAKLPAAKVSGIREKLCSLRWISFAPTNFDPQRSIFPSKDSLGEDLQVLRRAGFEGLITYGSNFEPGLVQVAQKAGFLGMIVGVWDPRSKEEIARARDAARSEIVLGLAVGNEGLGVRYGEDTLEAAIEELRRATGKSVTTTEQIEDYDGDLWLLELGDFVLPNVHPYWRGITDPHQAASWTEEQFHHLTARTTKPILFKEVGLPSAGDSDTSEQNQAEYYRLLGKREICFAYFEAYDQPWKQWAIVEPHWGLFRQDRSPKLVAQLLLTGH